MPKALSELIHVNPRVNLPSGVGASTHVSFIPMSDVTESGDWTGRQTRKLGAVASGFTAFADDDVLVAKITPCFENGKGAHLTGLTSGFGFGSTEFHVLRARVGVSARFIHHVAQSKRLRSAAEAYMSGSAGQKRVPREFFDTFVVPDLSPNEQLQICEVLDTLETGFRQTEAIIEKLKLVKQGLLHDLLTRGIDTNGELRPPQSQAPHLYKDSPLGWIPREWGSHRIREVVDKAANGASIRADEFRPSGTPVIAKGDVTAAKYIDTSRRVQFVASSLAAAKYKGSMINREFVVCSMRDLVPSAPTLGMASLLDAAIDGLLAQGTTALQFDKGRLDAELFVEITRLPWFRKKMRALAVGSTQVHMRGRDYLDVVIPGPPIEEQCDIVARIRAVDQSVTLNQAFATTLKDAKSGLMDDLLTGRVRVTPLLISDTAHT